MFAVIVTGPTCSGKGEVAYRLAQLLDGEIISLDSMKVYRSMDIGTAKPSSSRRRRVRYHLLDVVDPDEEYSVGRYIRDALAAAAEIFARGKRPIFAGGTPLYLRGLLRGFCPAPPSDPELRGDLQRRAESEGSGALHAELARADPQAAAKIHPNDRRRIIRALEVYLMTGRPFTEFWRRSVLRLPAGSYSVFGIRRPREEIYERINVRVERMVQAGLFEEARSVSERFSPLSRTVLQCIGYREIWQGMERGERREAIVRKIQRNTRHFARKQGTWFKRFSEIRWIPAEEDDPERIALRIAREVRFGIPSLAGPFFAGK